MKMDLEAWTSQELLDMASHADRALLGILLAALHEALLTSKAAIEILQSSEVRAGKALTLILDLVATTQANGGESVSCQAIVKACRDAQEHGRRLH